ncbi:hypothetical protein ACFLRC_03325 [Candidatus Altiarchaeota archaeon]
MRLYLGLTVLVLILTGGCISSPSEVNTAKPQETTTSVDDHVTTTSTIDDNLSELLDHPEIRYRFYPSKEKIKSADGVNYIPNYHWEYQTVGYLYRNHLLPKEYTFENKTLLVEDLSVNFEDSEISIALSGKYDDSDVKVLARKSADSRLKTHFVAHTFKDAVACPREGFRYYNEYLIVASIDATTENEDWNFIEVGYIIENLNTDCFDSRRIFYKDS